MHAAPTAPTLPFPSQRKKKKKRKPTAPTPPFSIPKFSVSLPLPNSDPPRRLSHLAGDTGAAGWFAGARVRIHARRSAELAGLPRFRDLGFAVGATTRRRRLSVHQVADDTATSLVRLALQGDLVSSEEGSASPDWPSDPGRSCFTGLLRHRLREAVDALELKTGRAAAAGCLPRPRPRPASRRPHFARHSSCSLGEKGRPSASNRGQLARVTDGGR